MALLPECAISGASVCSLDEIVQTFVNIARLMMGFVGSAVLVFFVYGGFVWITAGGAAEKIKKGKDIILNSVIGLLIVFGAFTIVQFIVGALGQPPTGETPTVAQIGLECRVGPGDQAKRGIVVANPESETGASCITDCGDKLLQSKGYLPMDPKDGVNCIYGISQGGADQVCCQPAPKTP